MQSAIIISAIGFTYGGCYFKMSIQWTKTAVY